MTINLIRLAPVLREGGINARRLIAETSDTCRDQFLGLAYPFMRSPRGKAGGFSPAIQ